jgi:hypothetical protein
LETRSDIEERKAAAPMPGGLRRGLIAALGIVFAGALYLIAVRGEALLLDLSAIGRAFCF